MNATPQITVIGSGFGALATVRELRRRDAHCAITLIAPRAELHYLPGIIWIPSGLRTREQLIVPLAPFFNDTDIFIFPGYEFQIVDAMVTNFHLPESTLIMLVSAFAGYDQVMAAYQAAVEEQYRFFSYGDAMFVTRRQVET